MIQQAKLRGDRLTNITAGGGGTSGYRMSEKTKALIRGKATGRQVSKKTRAKLSVAAIGKPSSMLGKKHAVETKRVMSQQRLGNSHNLNTDVSTEDIISQVSEGVPLKKIAEYFGVSRQTVRNRLRKAALEGLAVPHTSSREMPTALILEKLSQMDLSKPDQAKSMVAKSLGVSRSFVYARLKKHEAA